jgi:hypothetical protein
LLCLDGDRRSEKIPGKTGNECASRDHWISSSARASSDGGIVRPNAFAAFMLMTSSKVVGCSPKR